MCVPPKAERSAQKTAVKSNASAKKSTPDCQNSAPKRTLDSLAVAGATEKNGVYSEVVHATRTIDVTATTTPGDAGTWADVEWQGGTVDVNNQNTVKIDRTRARTLRVAAQLDGQGWLHKDIAVVNLLDLTCDLPLKLTDRDRHWKAYVSNKTATLKAVTDPNDPQVWAELQWSVPGAANKADVSLATDGDKQITVSLGKAGPKTLTADLHVCKWPKLELRRVGFDSYPIHNDGATEIDKQFAPAWEKGHADPTTNCVTANVQGPLVYAQKEPIKLTATFAVTDKPTDLEKVKIRGKATVGGKDLLWEDTVDVAPAATSVSTQELTSATLPEGVACHDAVEIEWSMIDWDQTTWIPLGKTKHLLYVLLGAPTKRVYWTLADISCRAAAGKKTENEFVPAAFVPFTTHTGDGKGFKRKGDGVEMSYYKQGVATSGDQTEPSVYSTFGILSRPDGTGRCGGWAELLVHLFGIHGVTSAGQRWFIRSKNKNALDSKKRFLVKKCSFAIPGTLTGRYTHVGNTECKKLDGVPGQGKTNPQFDFADHVVVKHNGKIYDPSYGVGPKDTDLAYEQVALDGLGYIPGPVTVFTMSDGTVQFISSHCSRGFLEYSMGASDTVSSVATTWGMSESALFDHPYNATLKALRKTADKVKAGDVVYIPRTSTMAMLDAYDL